MLFSDLTISFEVSSKISEELARLRAARLALLKEAAVPSGERALMPPSAARKTETND